MVFYFVLGSEADVQKYVSLPDLAEPQSLKDIHIKYCGHRLQRAQGYEEWLGSVPARFRDRCVKSEKGVDIEICCDTLRLAAMGKMDRLLLLTNDGDFKPLCRTLKDFGANISLFHLSFATKVNKDLAMECDSYDTLYDDQQLDQIRTIFA